MKLKESGRRFEDGCRISYNTMWKNKEEEQKEEEEEEHRVKAVHLCRGSTHRTCEMETKFSHA